jgi:hypothetical protein
MTMAANGYRCEDCEIEWLSEESAKWWRWIRNN